MALYDRLLKREEPFIPIHKFVGFLDEWQRGQMTRVDMITRLGIQVAEEVDLDATFARLRPPVETISMGCFVQFTNVGTAYDTVAQSRGLGVVRVQTAGITRVDVLLRVSKVGTGTQSWQLWDETNATQLAVFDDSAAAGADRSQLISFTPPLPLSHGVRIIRVRCKSTVAADDPIFLGACMNIQRAADVTIESLFYVLQLAHWRSGVGTPYGTTATVKTRLGI